MKKLYLKTFKTVINKVSSACISEKLLRKKAFCNTNIEKFEILHVLHDKVALLMRRGSLPGTRNCDQIIFRKVWTIYRENINQKMNFLYDSDEIKIRLPFYIFLFWWSLHSSFLFIDMG